MASEKKLLIGVDLGATNTKIALLSNRARVLARFTFPTASYSHRQALIEKLIYEIDRLLSLNTISFNNIRGIGIGLPGLIDFSRGIVFNLTNIPGWNNIPFKKILEHRLGMPVYIDNDVNAICLGEYLYGAVKGVSNVIALSLGTGVGGGIILNKSLYRGASFSAGEIGHILIDKNGPRCGCGRSGCLESYIGNYAIVRMTREQLKKKPSRILNDLTDGDFNKLTPKLINMAARKGDSLSIRVWQEAGRYLGIGLSILVNLINPDRIVLCGGVSKAGNLFIKSALEALKKYSMEVPCRTVKVVFSKLGDDAGIIGASCLVK